MTVKRPKASGLVVGGTRATQFSRGLHDKKNHHRLGTVNQAVAMSPWAHLLKPKGVDKERANYRPLLWRPRDMRPRLRKS